MWTTSQQYLFRLHQTQDELPSWNQGVTLVYMLKGKGSVYIEGEAYESQVSENDVFVINDFQLYHITLEADSHALYLLLSPHFFAEIAPEYTGYSIDCKSYYYPEDQQFYFDIIRRDLAIAFEYQYKSTDKAQIQVRSRLGVLFADLLRYFSREPDKEPASHTTRERLREVVQQINTEYHKPLSLQAIAQEHYISNSYLSRLFQQELDVTYTEYLTSVRLMHAKRLMTTDATITDIALDTGFPSANAMIDAFRKDTGMTPSQYRETIETTKADDSSDPPLVLDPSISFSTLLSYSQQPTIEPNAKLHGETHTVDIHVPEQPKRLYHKWKRILNAGYAAEILTHEVRQQLEMIQKSISFQYLRFHGLLDDDMQVYHENSDGSPYFNFVKINGLIDLILSLNFKPVIEFSYVPAQLSNNMPPLFRGISRPTMPSDLDKWTKLIRALVKNLVKRYGDNEVRTWLFSFSNSMDMADLGYFTTEEYLETYLATYRTVKHLDEQLVFMGAGTSLGNYKSLNLFSDYCKQNNCLPDLLCFHCYHGSFATEEIQGMQLQQQQEAFPLVLAPDPDFLNKEISVLKEVLSDLDLEDTPFFLDEWSNTIWQRDLTNDTSYKSAFLFKNILENYDTISGMGYWTASDYLSELPASSNIFHGGFGLLTRNGIPKSAFRAYELLAMIGDECLTKGEGYFVTRKEDSIQIYLYNYTHYDTLYRYRHTQNISMTDRYNVFNHRENQLFYLRLQNLPTSYYRVDTYSIGPEGGSTFDAWVAMGAPSHTTTQMVSMLERESYPVFHTKTINTSHQNTLKVLLVPHEVQCIVLTPIQNE